MLNENDWLPFWAKPLARMTWDHWERRLVRRCAGIVVVTEPIAKRYSRLHKNVRVVANYPDWQSVDDLTPMARDGRTCVISGSLDRDRGLSQVFEAMAILKQRDVEVPLELAGPSTSEEYLRSLWDEANRLGISRQVRYHGILSKSKSLILQQQASIGLVTYLPFQNCIIGLPNKLMECMALGVPVVCSDFPIYREVAGETGAAIMVDPTKPTQIADAIESLVRNPALARQMGEAGRQAVRNRFNWQAESKKLLDLYHQLVGAPNGNGVLI